MFRAIIVSSALALMAFPAAAGPEAEAVISGTAAQISDPVKGKDALRQSIDLPAVANFTLGKHARRISDADREKFAAAFENYLIDNFEDHRQKFAQAKVEVLGSKDRSPTDSIVETRITPAGEKSQTVRWRVIERDGNWRVVDVELLGLWLAIEQRAQIAAILDQPRATIDDAIRALNS